MRLAKRQSKKHLYGRPSAETSVFASVSSHLVFDTIAMTVVRLHKKLRSGKINKEEYKRLMRGEDGKGAEEFDDLDSDEEMNS